MYFPRERRARSPDRSGRRPARSAPSQNQANSKEWQALCQSSRFYAQGCSDSRNPLSCPGFPNSKDRSNESFFEGTWLTIINIFMGNQCKLI